MLHNYHNYTLVVLLLSSVVAYVLPVGGSNVQL